MKVKGLQHVSSPFGGGGQHALRAFDGDLLGLRELPTLAILRHVELTRIEG